MRNLTLIAVVLLLTLAVAPQTKDYTASVNPFIGTGGHGHTFPGATVPFGMVQLSPDTRIDNWDGSSGYHYSDNIIYGFSHTHLSGTGIPDGCDILLMPTVGRSVFEKVAGEDSREFPFTSEFEHIRERASPGYYSVQLKDFDILAELTSTKRVGMHRYTFPKADQASITLDLKWRDKMLGSSLKVVAPNRLEGFRKSSSWAKNQSTYFVVEFSKPFSSFEMRKVTGKTAQLLEIRPVTTGRLSGESELYESRNDLKAIWHFASKQGEQVMVKVAISYVSIEGARKNLEAELPGWDFDKVRTDAKAAWNKELSKIDVSGGTPEQTTNFYTALYHTMIQPNVFDDVDGQYLGHDRKVHSLGRAQSSQLKADSRNSKRNPSGQQSAFRSEQYTVFSLWDTFRAAHPLYTIIDQKRTVDFINTFIRQYEQGGRLPVWELWGEETDTMIGYHAVSVIADAMSKNIKGFDYVKAYAAAKHSAELDHFGLAGYKKRGYISMEDENESVSRTLEYAYNDWCIMSMAATLYNLRSLNKVNSGPGDAEYLKKLESDIERYRARARYFENLFDTKTGFFRPKKNGGFVEPFAPNEVTFGFTEGNSWQYSFFVPQDVTHLMTLMGGEKKFVAKLDELLTTDQKLGGREQADLTGLIGQYAHGNEPSHHITYLYNYAGQPWKTQKYVRFIMDNFYKNAPDGLIGNEDCGQMSAWYIMSASGFYPVTPGSPLYAFGTPLFPQMTYRLENGKTFTIRAKNLSPQNFYIAGAKLNGRPHTAAYITHDDIMRGGVLEFTMTGKPATAAFSEFPSSTIGPSTVAVPVIAGERSFTESTTVTLSTLTPNAKIFYLIGAGENGGLPNGTTAMSVIPYERPFTVSVGSTVLAIARAPGGLSSLWTQASFRKRPHDWTAKVLSGYSSQYTGGGENAIIDGIRGTVNFASGEWQGVQGKPYEAVIDLKRPTEIKELGASFLQVAGPWIWMPARVEFETSNDGVNFTHAVEIKPNFPVREMTPTAKEFVALPSASGRPITARYVRIRAHNFGKIPDWHPGSGGDPWIFIDEVIIR